MAASDLFANYRLASFALQSLVGVPPLGGGPPVQLSFNMQTQNQDQWCWAANAASVSIYFSPTSTWTQCSIVCAELNQTTCCADGATQQCDQPWTLDTALQRTNNLVRWSVGVLTGANIQAELAAGRPICCRIGWSGGGGHFVTISGYQNDGTVEEVTIDDPYYNRSQMSLSTFTTAYQNAGTWTHTYYTKA